MATTPTNVVGDKSRLVTEAARTNTNVLQANGLIKQTERLFSVRSRSARADYAFDDEAELGGDRGHHAFIKLLTSSTQAAEYAHGNSPRNMSSDLKGLVGEKSLLASASNMGYDQFLVTGISATLSEKMQITEVFGDSEVAYYFGRQPMVFNIQGLLVDSPDNDWLYNWLRMYDQFLRGSQTARNYELLKIVLPNMELVGTMMNTSFQQDSNRDVDIPFSFQFLAKSVTPIPAVNFSGGGMILSDRMKSVNFTKASTALSQAEINSAKAKVANLSTVIKNPSSTLAERSAALRALGTNVGIQVAAKEEATGFKQVADTVQKGVDNVNSGVNAVTASIINNSMFQTVTASLDGIRANLFSPIYGVLSSLTKLVSNVFNSANKIFNSVVTPVKNILRDITNISNKAISLVNLVNNSITGLGRNATAQVKGLQQDYKTAIKSLGKAAGAIATSPMTAAQSLKNMFSSGALTANAAFLQNTPKLTYVRPSLKVSGGAPATKATLLKSTPVYSSSSSNKLSS